VAFITEQRIWEAVFLLEAFLAFRWVGTDANYFDAVVDKCLEFIPESLAFLGSAGREGLGEEP
jgi:hypothetical protein